MCSLRAGKASTDQQATPATEVSVNTERISSSQPFLHKSWRRSVAGRTNGDAMLSGTYTELTTERFPRLVQGFSLMFILKANASVSTNHYTAKALSVGIISHLRLSSFTSFPLSSGGMDYKSRNCVRLRHKFHRLKNELLPLRLFGGSLTHLAQSDFKFFDKWVVCFFIDTRLAFCGNR